MEDFIEIRPGIWYEESTGLPWSSKKFIGPPNWYIYDYIKRPLKSKSDGYHCIDIDGKMKGWHRVVWEHFNGPIPVGMQVDHINNKRDDNRLDNLQLLSKKSNSKKRLKHKNNSSGYNGVTWDKKSNKWRARINNNGKSKHIGYFDDIHVAYEAYLEYKIKYHGEQTINILN